MGLPLPRSFREANIDFSDELLLGFNRSLVRLKSVALLEPVLGEVVGLDMDLGRVLGTFELLPLLLPSGLLELLEVLELFVLGL